MPNDVSLRVGRFMRGFEGRANSTTRTRAVFLVQVAEGNNELVSRNVATARWKTDNCCRGYYLLISYYMNTTIL